MSAPRLAFGGPLHGRFIAAQGSTLLAAISPPAPAMWDAPADDLVSVVTTTYRAEEIRIGGRTFRVWHPEGPITDETSTQAILALIDADAAVVRGVEIHRSPREEFSPY